MSAFDLVDQPWLEMFGPRGEETLSLRETLIRAHELRQAGGELPPYTVGHAWAAYRNRITTALPTTVPTASPVEDHT